MQQSQPQNNESVKKGAFFLAAAALLIAAAYIFGFFIYRFDHPVMHQENAPDTPIAVSLTLLYHYMAGTNISPEIESKAFTATLWALGALLALGAVAYWYALRWWKKTNVIRYLKGRHSSQQGTAEMGRAGDLKKLTGPDGVILGYNHGQPVRLSLRASCEHIAIIGPTGCGKTTRYFIPNLLDMPRGVSAIVTDPKGEIARVTAQRFKANGWNVYVFHPHESYDPGVSCVYNPVDIAISDTEISELAEIMLRNGYNASGQAGDTQWINFSQPLWEAALLAVRAHSREVPSVSAAYEIVATMTEEDRSEVFKNVGGAALDRYLSYLQSTQSPETSASIRTVLVSSIRNFVRPDISSVINGKSSFMPSMLREKPCILYMQVPERKSHLMKPLTATMYWQIIEHIIDKNGCPVYFYLDEFANIGQVPGFAQLAATARSRNISLNIGIQGIEQLTREYSREEQTDILNNMKTKIYFPGSTGEAGTHLANLGGYSTVMHDGASQRRELLTADELRRIPDSHVLVLAHNLNPVLLRSIPYFQQRRAL